MSAFQSFKTTAILVTLMFAMEATVSATTYNWTGSTSNSAWSTAANWDSNPTVPTFNASADLVWNSDISAATIKVYSYLGGSDGVTRVVQSLTFGDSFDIGAGNATYSIRLRSGQSAGSGTLSFRGVPSLTLEEDLGLGKDLKTVAIGNNFGDIDIRGNLAVNQNSTNVLLSFNAVVGQTGGSYAINKNGAGVLELYRNGSFSGGVNINAGTLIVRNAASAAGTGAIALGAADGADAVTLAIAGTPSIPQIFTNSIAVSSGSGARTIRNFETGFIPTLSGAIALEKDVNVDVAIHLNNQEVILKGAISGTGGVVKTGAGILTLSGTNTYSGVTTVSAGTLVLKGNKTINDLAKLVLGADTAFTMDFAGVETVERLSLDGGATWLPGATYDAAALGGLGSGTYGGAGSIKIQPTTTEIGLVSIRALGNTNVVLEWGGESGFSYGVEGKTDLVFGEWEPVASNYVGTGGLLSHTGSVAEAKTFFRIVLE